MAHDRSGPRGRQPTLEAFEIGKGKSMSQDTSAKAAKRRAKIEEGSVPLVESVEGDSVQDRVASRKWTAKQIAVVLFCLLAIYSPAMMLYKVHANSVDVPFWDEWDYVKMFREVSEGEIPLTQFLLSTAGEHKVAGQVLLSIAGWQITGMREPLIMTFNWLLGVGFCLLAALITRRAFPGGIQAWVALATASFLLFNPAAYQPWLWAIPTVYLLIPLLFFSGVAVIQSKWSLSRRIAVCGAVAFIGSFTLGSGVLLWGLFPAVWLLYATRSDIFSVRTGLALYLALLVLTGLVFISAGMHTTAPAAPGTGISDLAAFFFTYTGNFVALSAEAAPVSQAQFVGLALVVFFAVISWLATRVYRNRPEFKGVAVWILLGFYSIVAGLLITWARIGFGVKYPLEASRYIVASCFLPLACLVLATILLVYYVQHLSSNAMAYSAVLACTAILVATIFSIRLLQTQRAYDMMTHSYFHQLRGKVAVAAANYIHLPTYSGIFPKNDFPQFLRSVRFLNARKWLHPTIWDETFLKEAASKPPNASYGNIDKADRTAGKTTLAGWAYLVDRAERPHAIFALAVKAGSTPHLVGVVFPSTLRQDIYERFHNFEALSTGWSMDVPEWELNDPLARIVCFAYDANSGSVYRVSGEVSGNHLQP